MAIGYLRLTDGVNTIDFHSDDYRILKGGLSLPPPVSKPNFVESPFIDGDRLASLRYSNRTITIKFLITGTSYDDLQTNVRAIQRILNDAEKRLILGYGTKVYLEYQWGLTAGECVYFDVNYGELILPEDFSTPILWREYKITNAVVKLDCKPFGRYTNQDIAQETLENEQSGAALNYQDILTTAGHGDVPAKMYWKLTMAGAAGSKKIWLAKRSGVRYNDTLWIQGEDEDSDNCLGDLISAGYEDQVDAALSGGNYARIIRAVAKTVPLGTLISYVNYDIATPPRGQFRVLLYCRTTHANGAAEYAKMAWGFGYAYGDKTKAPVQADGDFIENAADNTWEMLDLGLLNIPPIAESDIATINTFTLRIHQLANEALTVEPTWTTPTGFVDPDVAWGNETYAYDDNLTTHALTTLDIVAGNWSSFLEITRAAMNSGGCRYYIQAGYGVTADDLIDVDAYYGGAWHHCYEGPFSFDAWNDATCPDGVQSVTAYRFRFYNGSVGDHKFLLTEVDFAGSDCTTWDWDYIFLLPVDEGLVIINNVAAADVIAVDGITDRPNVFILAATGEIEDYPTHVGKPFTLGRENTRLYVIRDDAKGVTFASDVKYQPQFGVV